MAKDETEGLSVVAPPEDEKRETKGRKKRAAKKAPRKKAAGGARRKKPAKKGATPMSSMGVFSLQFQQVSIGQDTARVGCKILRDSITPTVADRVLCGRRLDCTITAIEGQVDEGQQDLPGVNRSHRISAVADVKQVSVYPKHISFGLTFSRKELDIEELADFAKQRGKLHIDAISNLDEIEAEAKAEKEAERDEARAAKKSRRGRRKA